jgi:adenine phosphoribosyltransferase
MDRLPNFEVSMDLKSLIRTIPDFPKAGIEFRDITSLLADPMGLSYVIDQLALRYKTQGITQVVGIESRGFMVGGALAYKLGVGFVPVRKPGKLPGEVISQDYQLEYGTDTLEIHRDALTNKDVVVIVDDLMATGGTALGARSLVVALGARVLECAVVIDLPDLGGAERCRGLGMPVHTLVQFEGH